MRKARYGDPTITIRLPADYLDGLKTAAEKHGSTPSAILRDLIHDYLRDQGITGKTAAPLPGQQSI